MFKLNTISLSFAVLSLSLSLESLAQPTSTAYPRAVSDTTKNNTAVKPKKKSLEHQVFYIDEVLIQRNYKKLHTIELDRDALKNSRGTTNADFLNGIPGIQLNNIRNEAGALDVSIRGIQGQGRVPVLIDGNNQSVQTFRGYQGTSDRSYVDMDMISKVSIGKGGDLNPNALGATGGYVEMKTLDAHEIILPGKQFGFYIKGSLFNNAKTPSIPEDEKAQNHYILQNNIKESSFKNGNMTFGVAFQNKDLDIISLLSYRKQGNYFAGEQINRYHSIYNKNYYGNIRLSYKYDPEYLKENIENWDKYYDNPAVRPGQEVPNTSYQSISSLTKLGWNIAPHHRLDLSYRYHSQKAGEVLAAYWTKSFTYFEDSSLPDAPKILLPQTLESMPQWSLGTTDLHFYSAQYKLLDRNQKTKLTISAFGNSGEYLQHNGFLWVKGAQYGDQYLHRYSNAKYGITAHSHTNIDLKQLSLLFHYGISTLTEISNPKEDPNFEKQTLKYTSRHGRRNEFDAFLNTGAILFKKLKLSAGMKLQNVRINDYNSKENISYGPTYSYYSKLYYSPLSYLTIFANYSDTYRSPSMYESTVSSQVFSYNPEYPLVPEHTKITEVGIRSEIIKNDANHQWSVMANLFNNDIRQFITTAIPYTEEKGSSYTFINYDKYQLKGLEISSDYQNKYAFANVSMIFYGKPTITSHLLASLSLNDIPATNSTGFGGDLFTNRLPAKRMFNANAGLYFLKKQLTTAVRYRAHSGTDVNNTSLEGTGAQGLVEVIPKNYVLDAYAIYRAHKKMNFSIHVDNITDRYQFDLGSIITIPMPGRTIRLGIEMNF